MLTMPPGSSLLVEDILLQEKKMYDVEVFRIQLSSGVGFQLHP